VIEDVVALSRHLIHTSGVDLKLSLEPDLPWVSMDSNQMKQVLLNLVHNALQAMPTGGQLEIKSESAMRNQRPGVMVSVCDSGVGIPPAEQARIFEPFYTTKGNQGGTGLGLSVTYGIVTDHGGQIDLESQPGVGSKFMVWLPL
jgi:two-component system NtrC family sensor kinase